MDACKMLPYSIWSLYCMVVVVVGMSPMKRYQTPYLSEVTDCTLGILHMGRTNDDDGVVVDNQDDDDV